MIERSFACRLAVLLFPCFLAAIARAADWPTYRGDIRRSGVSEASLAFPLGTAWTHRPVHPPAPAWPEMTAPQDYWHHLPSLSPTHTYDRAYQVVVAGQNLYYGSSADDAVYCVDLGSGAARWSFFTEGPVRLVPTVVDGRLYVGSDDGWLYCLDAAEGTLRWRYKPRAENDRLPGNGRMISRWPVRCGIVVDAGTVYFTSGLFPLQGVELCAVAAADGKELWRRPIDVSAQGYLLAAADRLFVPTGRTAPEAFDRASGKPLGDFGGVGGCFALVAGDMLVHGASEDGQIHINEPTTREGIVSTPGLRLVAKGPMVYILSHNSLLALDRRTYLDLSKQIHAIQEIKKPTAEQKAEMAALMKQREGCRRWKVACQAPYELIMAGDVLLAGGEDRVVAMNSADGKPLWTGKVDGKAYGLAVAGGRLLVSTDRGAIQCFEHGPAAKQDTAAGDAPKPTAMAPDESAAAYRDAAETILNATDVRQGYCLVLGAGTGGLARELALRSDLQIIGVEEDAAKIAAARKRLSAEGLQGVRVVMHQGKAGDLAYRKQSINLIVSDAALGGGELPPPEPIARVLRPCGGTVAMALPAEKADAAALARWGEGLPGWKTETVGKLLLGTAVRGPLAGSAEWTHAYAEPGNTASSGDRLLAGPMDMQWFGRPGPRRMIDRHHMNVSSLYKDGRLFVPGDCTVYAVDAYNGTILWQADVPRSRRLAMSHDCGSMAVDAQRLYLATEKNCLGLDVKTGLAGRTYAAPQLDDRQLHHWGYVAYGGNVLLGSGTKPAAAFTETGYAVDDSLWGRGQQTVTSDYLFGMDLASGNVLWTYRSGLILNTTIAAGDGRVWCVETTSPKALANKLGRMKTPELFDGGEAFLVALDQKTGKLLCRRPLEVSNFEEIVFLNRAGDTLVLSGSKAVGNPQHAYVYAFDALTGEPLWNAHHDTELDSRGTHGEQNRHPTIVGQTVYAWPYAYELRSGNRVEGWKMDRRGHGCGELTASARCLFWRGGNPWMYDLTPGGGPARLTAVTRIGCWINVIPAGGLVLIPESSSGCTCPYSIQTSIALAPREAGP